MVESRRFDRVEGPFYGFLLIRCDECGAVSAYNAREPRYAHRCKACGEETPLESLKPVYMQCPCGRKYRYLTNIADETFTHKCMHCGRDVMLTMGRKRIAYVTVAAKGWRGKDGKGWSTQRHADSAGSSAQ